MAILHGNDSHPSAVQDALKLIEQFCSECQMQYMAFNLMGGRLLAHERFRSIYDPQNYAKLVFVGTQYPDGEQSPGKSAIAQTKQGNLLDALAPGGAFEQAHAAAFAVFVYALWEENYRKRIGNAFGVSKDAIKCDLMGEIRHVRNWIVHDNSVAPHDWQVKCPMLAQLWEFEPGELVITEKMLHSLMEQINALRIKIAHEH